MIIEALLTAYNLVWFMVNGYNLYPVIKSRMAGGRTGDDGESYARYMSSTSDWPMISVLIPAYQEESVLERCVSRLYGSNYPNDRLDLIILTEKDDPGTAAIARKCERTYGARHLIARDTGEPRGKPRALKQGFRIVRGEIVGVIDAEDIIDPELFRHVAYEIREKGRDVIQGKLDMSNDEDGWKNAQFRAEYGFWYNHYLPHLARSRLPIPLGGTTNFFRREVLEAVDDWDAYNLTEDFELGLRLYNLSPEGRPEESRYSVGVFDCVTREESPLTWNAWIRQRTRWQRGKIQTLKKLIGNPRGGMGRKAKSLMACMSPHFSLVSITGIVAFCIAALYGVALPLPLAILSYFNLATIPYYCVRQGAGYLKATEGEQIGYRRTKALILAVSLPVYWAFQWAADLRAIKQEYVDRRIFWEKTGHSGRNLLYTLLFRLVRG